MDIFELETQYLKAKEVYYNGEPIMSDEEFDELEELLKTLSSDVVNLVGTTDRRFKHQHLSPMCSLDKIQTQLVDDAIIIPWDQVNAFFDKFPKGTVFEASSKYDGLAINLIYRKGNIEKAITRGDKLKGKDATNKLMRKIPLTIKSDKDVEVRGEVVMPVSIFNEKYLNHPDEAIRKYKNPRNFCAGVINKDDVSNDLMNEIMFMAVEARIYDGDYEYPENTQQFLSDNGFNKSDNFIIKFTSDQFEEVYYRMKAYRENESPFQLDGFVIKAPENIRKEMGENGHHPCWSIAIKYPPKVALTKVVGLKNKVSVDGENIPGIELEGVDLDGSTIRNTAGFNWGYIIKNGLFPGAKVEIAKSGDIIPIVTKVISPVYKGDIPTHCQCGSQLVMEGIHLMCKSETCEVKMLKRFIVGVGEYKMDKFGAITRRSLFEAGYKEIADVFDLSKFNEESLISTGRFKSGKTLSSLLEEMNKIKTVTLSQIIVSLGFEGVGHTASKQLAKYIRGKEYDFKGLEKASLVGFDEGDKKREKIENLVKVFEKRGVIIEEEIEVKDGIGVELTGSPKDSGFKVKSDLEKFLLSHGYVHKGLKEAKFLLTDSLGSSSSKMTQAKKLGVKIYEYSDFIERLKNGLEV